jgi:uncharacterized membrane protein HdeD (DUF308 family)
MEQFAKSVTDNWWVLIFEGILAILFGAVAWIWPGLTVVALVALFGAFSIVTGVMSLVAAYAARRVGQSPWLFVFRGVLGIGAGIVVFVWPDISALALLYVIAAWAFLSGISELMAAISLRRTIDNEWFMALAGIASIVFGVLVAIFPGAGAVALVWTIGIYAIFFGVMLVALGVRLRGLGERIGSPAS